MVDETQQPVKENDNARSVETNTQNGAEEVIQNAVTSQEAAPEVATENEQVAAEAGIETETSEAVEAESAPPAPVESLPVESAAAPAQLPWWKRLFARKAKPVKSDDSVAAPPAMSEMGGVKESSTPTLAAVPTPGTPLPAGEGMPTLELPPPPPGVTLDEVRILISEQLARAQADITRAAQAELARLQQDRQRTLLTGAQDAAESVFAAKTETFRTEMDALRNEEQRTLNDQSRPLRERMIDVDYIRERMTLVEQGIAEHEKAAARRVAEVAHMLAELEGRGIVADMRTEVDRQKETIYALQTYVQQLAQMGPGASKKGLQIPQVIVIVLVLIFGAAGVFLPLNQVDTQSEARALLESAALYNAAGEKDDAQRILDDVIKLNLDSEMQGRAGQIYYSLGQYTKAINLLEKAVAAEPKRQTYRLFLARSYNKSRKYQESIDQYTALLTLAPNSVTGQLEMGGVYETMTQYDKARERYVTVTQLASDRVEGYYALGQLYRVRLLEYDKAIEQYLQVLKINPEHYLATVYYGASLAGQGKYEDALAQYQKAVEINAEGSAAPFFMGDAYQAMGKYENALEWYQRALDLNPSSFGTRMAMGNVYVTMGDCTNAVKQFDEALIIAPTNNDALAAKAQCGQ